MISLAYPLKCQQLALHPESYYLSQELDPHSDQTRIVSSAKAQPVSILP